MNKPLAVLAGTGAGAGLIFLLDPARGRRRRKLAADKVTHMTHVVGDSVEGGARDVRNRSLGRLHELCARLQPQDVDDRVLVERVRSAIGRAISHPGAIEVTAEQGTITLSGPILRDEKGDLMSRVARVRGVRGVTDRLMVLDQAGDVPGLQGDGKRPGRRLDILQEYWSPSTRLAVSTAGGGLALWGVTRGGLTGAAAGLAGLGLLTRALTNLQFQRIVGIGAGRRAVDVHKTITVDAPVEEVYAFWANLENLPRIMEHVHEVRDHGNGRSHWRVAGPAGISVGFDAIVTRSEPNRVLAWKTLPGQTVQHAGIIRFEPQGRSTRLDIRMSYNPPVGAIGHVVAACFGSDPKQAMDEDLVRFKSLIEHGKTTAHSTKTTREDVQPAQAPPPETTITRAATGRSAGQ